MHTTSEKLVANFTLQEKSLLSSLEENLSSIESKKSELINEINNKFEATISTLDKKIEGSHKGYRLKNNLLLWSRSKLFH